jgi:hypothetical protein
MARHPTLRFYAESFTDSWGNASEHSVWSFRIAVTTPSSTPI